MAEEESRIKNIIYMIPDGGGMDPYYLTDALKQAGGIDKELFPNSTVTETGEMYFASCLISTAASAGHTGSPTSCITS